jgi:hypothetical protein
MSLVSSSVSFTMSALLRGKGGGGGDMDFYIRWRLESTLLLLYLLQMSHECILP